MVLLPGSKDVETVSPRVSRDPGLNAPAGAVESSLSIVAEEISPVLKEISIKVQARQEKMETMRRQADLNTRKTDAARRSLKLQKGFKDDVDYKTHGERVKIGLDNIKKTSGQDLDEEQKLLFNSWWDQKSLIDEFKVISNAEKSEILQNKEDWKTNMDTLAEARAEAETPQELANINQQMSDLRDSGVSTGLYTENGGKELTDKAGRRSDLLRLNNAIRSDPDLAKEMLEKNAFPFFEPEDVDKAEKAIDTEKRRVITEVDREVRKAEKAFNQQLKITEKELNRYIKVLSLGGPVNEETAREMQVKAEAVGLTDEFNAVIEDIDQLADFSIKNVSGRGEELVELASIGTVESAEDFISASKKNQEINEFAKKDSYKFGVQQGIIDFVPIDFDDPDTILARSEQAGILSDHYGIEADMFTSDEATQLTELIKEMTVKEKVVLAGNLNVDETGRVFEQLAEKDSGIFPQVAAIGDEDLMAAIFTGDDEIKKGNLTAISKKNYIEDFDAYIGETHGIDDKAELRRLSEALYAQLYRTDEYDKSNFVNVLNTITGGVVDINNNRTLLPRGVDENQFDNFIENFSPEGVATLGGVQNYTDEQAAELIQHPETVWEAVKSGSYIVRTRFGYLIEKDSNKPLVIPYNPELSPNEPFVVSGSLRRLLEQ